MRFNYQFSNLCGTVYRQGNVLFTPDGNSLVSPVGNRVSVFDLVNNRSLTLPVETRRDIVRLALSPNAALLLAVDEDGRALLVNFRRHNVLHHFNFKEPVYDIQFAPNGRFFAVTHGKLVQVWRTPSLNVEFAPFILHRTYGGHYDDTLALDWSPDSRFFLSCSKDLTARLFSLDPEQDFEPVVFAGHRERVVGAFFAADKQTIYTISRDGALFVWRPKTNDPSKPIAFSWQLATRHYFRQAQAKVATVAFHRASNVLVVGFSTGIFGLYELPDCNNIHTLSISQHKITAAAVNATGEWLAFGSSSLGQLLVWEWQSESYVLRQQGHTFPPSCVAYTPDGQTLITGGDDGRVKLWNATSGFCFVTFSDHTGAVTAVDVAKTGQVVLAASKDGTVRAFDLLRYRNFRTMTTPRPLSLASLALDSSGELVCAGSEDSFEIYVWSLQTGKLLDVLSGHEGPVMSVSFSPSVAGQLASASWDSTVRVWDVFGGGRATQTFKHGTDVLAVTYRPDGLELAASTLDGQIAIWDVRNGVQLATIEGRKDIAGGRSVHDRRSAMNSSAGKAFTSLCYTADGQCLLAGGSSKFVCIYEIKTTMLIRKFAISSNRSLDGVLEFLSNRDNSEAGPLALIDDDDDDEDATDRQREKDRLKLPGVQRVDMSTRTTAAAVRTFGVRFSPTGRSFACAATEGLLIYSLDDFLLFDPIDLEVDLTPQAVDDAIAQRAWLRALVMALRLNEEAPLRRAYLAVPSNAIELVAHDLPIPYLDSFLRFIATQMSEQPHLEFHLKWVQALLSGNKGPYLRQTRNAMAPQLRALHKALVERRDGLAKLCDSNLYLLKYLQQLSTMAPAQAVADVAAEGGPVSLSSALAAADGLLAANEERHANGDDVGHHANGDNDAHHEASITELDDSGQAFAEPAKKTKRRAKAASSSAEIPGTKRRARSAKVASIDDEDK